MFIVSMMKNTLSLILIEEYGLSPFTVTVPPSGISRPAISLIDVVFPAPFGPTKPVMLPSETSNDIESSALNLPNLFVTLSKTIAGVSFASRDKVTILWHKVQRSRPGQ